MEQQTKKQWSEAVVYTAMNVILPSLDACGLTGAEGTLLQVRTGLKDRMRANCLAYLVEQGHAFHTFRPSGKVGRVARVFVSTKFAGQGNGGAPENGWTQP